jgi:hypothetical protein
VSARIDFIDLFVYLRCSWHVHAQALLCSRSANARQSSPRHFSSFEALSRAIFKKKTPLSWPLGLSWGPREDGRTASRRTLLTRPTPGRVGTASSRMPATSAQNVGSSIEERFVRFAPFELLPALCTHWAKGFCRQYVHLHIPAQSHSRLFIAVRPEVRTANSAIAAFKRLRAPTFHRAGAT